ncbi:MAG: 3-hydroxyacyl-CoA dehydrogenase NAD-binding domain-containing protein [Pirellulaceae bacterium]
MHRIINQSVSVEEREDQVWTVWLDSHGRSVNVFDAEMLSGLESVINHIAMSRQTLHAVVFRSRKASGFFAGADVHAIAQLETAEAARQIIQRGQDLMSKLESLSVPTVAAIDGICMGGGLEFALSCRYRIASDSARTLLGLPEIKLGLLPAWGGTQRLTRRIGVRKALEMILKGSPRSAAKALRYGLVDRVLNTAKWDTELAEIVDLIAAGRFAVSRPSRTIVERMEQSWLGSRIVLRAAAKRVAPQFVNYPATEAVLSAVRLALDSNGAGYHFERESFCKLLFTSTARSLLGLFELRDRAKKVATWLDVAAGVETADHAVSKFSRIAVIGAGAMGAGIGTLAAIKGYKVVFKEIDAPAADAGRRRAEELLGKQVTGGRLSLHEQQDVLRRMAFTPSWTETADCDLAIEAVLEVEEAKRDVFRDMDESLPKQAVLASNTSSLNVTRMAMVTQRAGQVAGLHFFNPVDKMDLVEVVRTEATSEETLQSLLEFVKRLGKTPIVTSDKPGFLVNRILFPYLGEAVRMVASGFSIAQIDDELRRFGMPMGPLELLDQVGIDIASHVACALTDILPDSQVPADFLADMAGRGLLGKKSKLGFYDYRSGKLPTPNGDIVHRPCSTTPHYEFLEDGLSNVQRRLIYALLNEAVHCLDEQVVAEPWMVDLGMVLGTGFAPLHGGPLRLIDSLGIATVQHNMTGLAQVYGDRFKPADGIDRVARNKSRFLSDGGSMMQDVNKHHQPPYPSLAALDPPSGSVN